MRTPVLILAVIAATLTASAIHAQERATPASEDQTDESAKRIKEQRKERVAVLKQQVEGLTTLFKDGRARVSSEEVLGAMRLLIEAELEVAETDAERVDRYKRLVAVLRDHEKVAETQVRAARGLTTSVLKVKASRLQAEIYLEQAQAKVKGAKPGAAQPEPPPPNMAPPRRPDR
jgi:hypothetical protein